MPANIPSPIVGGGGNQRGIGESLLLALASSAPQVLFGILNRMQEGQKQSALDQAAGAGLTTFAADANADERRALEGAGALTTPPDAQGLPASMRAVGRIAPEQLPSGVAPELLRILTGQRSERVAQEASQAQAAGARGREARDAELQPGRVAQQEAELARTNLEMRLAEDEAERSARRLALDEQRTAAAVLRDEVSVANLRREANVQASDRAQLHMREFRAQLNALRGTMAGAGKAISRREASELVFGTPEPPTIKELTDNYSVLLAEGDAPPLIEVVRGRMQEKYGMTPEQYSNALVLLETSQNNARNALSTLRQRGLSDDELRNVAKIYSVELGEAVKLPVEWDIDFTGILPTLPAGVDPTNIHLQP